MLLFRLPRYLKYRYYGFADNDPENTYRDMHIRDSCYCNANKIYQYDKMSDPVIGETSVIDYYKNNMKLFLENHPYAVQQYIADTTFLKQHCNVHESHHIAFVYCNGNSNIVIPINSRNGIIIQKGVYLDLLIIVKSYNTNNVVAIAYVYVRKTNYPAYILENAFWLINRWLSNCCWYKIYMIRNKRAMFLTRYVHENFAPKVCFD